jgi:hypothetical protein
MAYGIHPKVSFYTFIATLGSSMMAPAVPEIAEKYGMAYTTDRSSSVRLTYTLTARYHEIYNFGNDPLDFFLVICPWAAICRTLVRNVWPHMGKLDFQFVCLSIADADANLRFCTSVTWFMQFLIWVAHFRRTQDPCLRSVSFVGTLPAWSVISLNCTTHGIS